MCLHYLVTCGACDRCRAGREQFCAGVEMIGKHRDGGFAELACVPARNAFPLPASIPFEHGAILMCSSATALHALRKARLAHGESVAEIWKLTDGRGVDIALELVGLPRTMEQAIDVLGIHGRVALVGLTGERIAVSPYRDILNKEAEVIGVSDHLASELPELIELVASGRLDLSYVVTRVVPLDAQAVNGVLDDLAASGDEVRCVIRP